jgi:cytidylate kinase
MLPPLKKVIEFCSDYDKIIVTGPQRSGTTIASEILAHELGYENIREEKIKFRSLSLLYEILGKREKTIIQAPNLASVCHFIDHHVKKIAIVFMRRNPNFILESQKRIGWQFRKLNLHHYFVNDGEIARVRYNAWEKYQKDLMRSSWIELKYSELNGHPLWIKKEDRKEFRPRQTEL